MDEISTAEALADMRGHQTRADLAREAIEWVSLRHLSPLDHDRLDAIESADEDGSVDFAELDDAIAERDVDRIRGWADDLGRADSQGHLVVDVRGAA